MQDLYDNVKKSKPKDSVITITAELPALQVEKATDKLVDQLGKTMELPGFRKGHVPAHIVREQISETVLREEAVGDLLQAAVTQLIRKEELLPFGSPRVTELGEVAKDKPVTFTVEVTTFPDVKLPNYKKIADGIAAEGTQAATDEEVEETVKQLMQSVSEKTGDEAPAELTDDAAKTFGPFETAQALRDVIKTQLTAEKEQRARRERRDKMVDAIVSETKVDVPASAVADEVENFTKRREDELKQLGMTLEQYCEAVKKTEKELSKEVEDAAARIVKTRLVIRELVKTESIEPNPQMVEMQKMYLSRQYPDQSPHAILEAATSMAISEQLMQRLEGSEAKQEA